MLTDVALSRFRTHKSLVIENIPALAVIAGQNNTGKSAILHAIAWPKYNGRLVAIEGREISFRGEGTASIKIGILGASADSAAKTTCEFSVGINGSIESMGGEGGFIRRSVYFLSPNRVAPRAFTYQRLGDDVGINGELTWPFLRELRDLEDERYGSLLEAAKRLGLHLTAIGTPSISPQQGAISVVTYGDRLNVALTGAGLGAVLPILTQGVLCGKGSTLLIEEPETHLNYAALDGLWEFFGDCVKRGVQVISTTHSLDFLVSMSHAIRDGKIPEQSRILHLKRDAEGITSIEPLGAKRTDDFMGKIRPDLKGLSFP